jgi:hypothetical protein
MAPHALALPSAARLAVFAVLLPAAVAATNYALLFHDNRGTTRAFLCPWMALSTAVLSWCVGRYLWPAALRWLVFAWALVLLDLLTFSACLGGLVEREFGYVLVTSQISFLVLWAALGPQPWQWRLPIVVATAAGVIGFSGSFDDGWSSGAWNLMMFLTAMLMIVICVGLRWRGYTLKRASTIAPADSIVERGGVYQFGMRHMLVWAAAIAPLLLVARGLDYVLLGAFDGPSILPAALMIAAVATVCLIAIWAVLGSGLVVARIAVLTFLPPALGLMQAAVADYYYAKQGGVFFRGPIFYRIGDFREEWIVWMGLTAALLAALLLFLRADGYRLIRVQ